MALVVMPWVNLALVIQVINQLGLDAVGSLTFDSFYAAGNSYYVMVAALGGTPSNSNDDYYNWGANQGGGLGRNATALSTPTQPQTTSLFTHTVTSTSSNTAPTKTDVAFPVNDIHHVYPIQGAVGYSGYRMIVEDQYGSMDCGSW